VYGIVRQAGGHVTVESRPRHGTTFRIVLPAAPNGAVAQPADTASTESMSPAAPGAAGNALLVEDNDAVRALAADALRAYGFDVTAVGSGAEALDLGDAGLHPQLLVTDVVMPGIGGIELARALRERFPDLPVLFATAHSERDPVHALAGSAPTALLPKPFTADELGSRSRVLVADARRRAVA
jgi:two-component system, cell cycle sensor histidine kinase and response regulator CckA